MDKRYDLNAMQSEAVVGAIEIAVDMETQHTTQLAASLVGAAQLDDTNAEPNVDKQMEPTAGPHNLEMPEFLDAMNGSMAPLRAIEQLGDATSNNDVKYVTLQMFVVSAKGATYNERLKNRIKLNVEDLIAEETHSEKAFPHWPLCHVKGNAMTFSYRITPDSTMLTHPESLHIQVLSEVPMESPLNSM